MPMRTCRLCHFGFQPSWTLERFATAATADLFSCFDVQVVARAFERAGADQDALVNEILKVAGGRGARSAGDRNVILGAQAALEALHPFAENQGENFFLSLIELTLDFVVE